LSTGPSISSKASLNRPTFVITPSNAALLTTDQLNPDAGVLKRRFDSGGDRNREG
jgi:hypothetical protein